MHSFEVNIKICQPKNSDAHQGEAEVNITFEGWLILIISWDENNIIVLTLYLLCNFACFYYHPIIF